MKEYRAIMDNIGDQKAVGADQCVHTLGTAYKKTLAAMKRQDIQFITPSSFIKEIRTGAAITDDELADDGRSRPCGIHGHDFAPLFRDFRERRPDVAKKFKKNFDKYRDEAVKPLFDAVKDCDRLLYLVDIPAMLSDSDRKFNEITHILQGIGKALDETGRFARIVKYLFGRLEKILFVAAKSDMVSRADQGNLRLLTENLMEKLKRSMSETVFEAHCVSAWESARGYAGNPYEQNAMRLREDRALKDLENTTYEISKLPAEWPHGWKKGDYIFPPLALYPLRLHAVAPRQQNLDKLFLALL